MSLRVQPQVGAAVLVVDLGARTSGHLTEVQDDGRRLDVVTDDGEVGRFVLNPATGHFTADGRQWGARLIFETQPAAP